MKRKRSQNCTHFRDIYWHRSELSMNFEQMYCKANSEGTFCIKRFIYLFKQKQQRQ